ncbi:hypothetical protein TruAng_011956 [Truncatella angustata]|nr:hypothetical protein TruAng_011956 [Truncatella angustata]
MKKFERQAQSQRKHGPLVASSVSKAPPPPPRSRPGWTGPGYVKKVARKHDLSSASPASAPSIQDQLLSLELHQLMLNVIQDTFPASHDYEALKPVLSHVNNALLRKDFETAFGADTFLEAYAVRWSPSRALAYSNLLAQVCEQTADGSWVRRWTGLGGTTSAKVLCFGGGAAEIVAFAGLLRHEKKSSAGRASASPAAQLEQVTDSPPHGAYLDVHLVDAADWSTVVSKLQVGLTTPPNLSKYASAAARASNAAFLSLQALQPNFTRADVFVLTLEDLRSLVGSEVPFITLFFTLNDLYTVSIRNTTAFLRRLTIAVPKGSLLLVVDHPEAASSAGSAQEGDQKGDKNKEYPMSWLLNKALLPTMEKVEDGQERLQPLWKTLIHDANRLYKLPDKALNYPVSLENLKLQVHLFERL